MKKCEQCNITYDDSKNFCKKCGNALADDHKLESKEAAKKQVFEDRLKIDPLNFGLLHEYAKFLFGNSLHKDAIAVLLKILALDEKDETATDLLFQSYQNLQMHKEAGETGKQLLAFRPGDIPLYESLILIFAALNNSTETLGLCDHVLNTEPKNVVALYHKALIMLEENDLPKACAFFKQAYEAGQKDQITVIYSGIHHALQAEFEQAIDLLLPCLDKDQDYAGNISIQRGVLYMAFSLSKTTADLSHVKQWFAKVDPALHRKNNFPQDENAVVEITRFVIDESLNKISASADAKYELGHLIKTYLGVDYFSAECSPVMAGLWYKVGSKEAELVSVSDAIISFQQAVELMPEEAKYTEALARAKAELAQIQKKRKRKQVLTYATALGFIALIIGSVFLYKFISEKNSWNEAVNENTTISYQKYLRKYPDGRFYLEALKLKEDALWENTKKTDDYEEYIENHPNGRYIKEALGLKEKKIWKTAIDANSDDLFYNYLEMYPFGVFTKDAKERITFSDPRDNKTYFKIQIGKQVWMAENLNFETKRSSCYYHNPDFCKKYGRLYHWKDAMIACPPGWHLPSQSEWEILIEHLGGYNVAGGKMKSKNDWGTKDNVSTNESRFSAKPGGFRWDESSGFNNIGHSGHWWSSTITGYSPSYFYMGQGNTGISIYKGTYFNEKFYSVRCVKND